MAILTEKVTKFRTTTDIVKNSRTRDGKIRSLLSWQQSTIRHLSTDIGGEGSFSGGRNIPRNPPGTQIRRVKSVIAGILRERRLGPPETVLCEGTV